MPWNCWLGDRNGIWPVKSWVLVCWWWRSEWSFACLIAPVVTTTSIIISSNNIQNGDILVVAYPRCHGTLPLNECHSVAILTIPSVFDIVGLASRWTSIIIIIIQNICKAHIVSIRAESEVDLGVTLVHQFDSTWPEFDLNSTWNRLLEPKPTTRLDLVINQSTFDLKSTWWSSK